MKQFKKISSIFLILMLIFQSLGIQFSSVVKAEEQTTVDVTQYKAQYGTTVRGGSYADQTATTGSTTIPREILEAKLAGDMSYSRRSHLEFDMSSQPDWNNVTSVKLVLYLYEHSGTQKSDTIQVLKTDKPTQSEENWTWNNTAILMQGASVVGEQQLTAENTGTWVEIDITDLKKDFMADPDTAFALALNPKAKDDQGGVKFYSQHQEGGKYTPYINVYEGEYTDNIPPSVHVDGIKDNQKVYSETFQFDIKAIDNVDKEPTIHLTVNGESVSAVSGKNTITLKPGQNKVEVMAEDASGNKSDSKVFNVELERALIFPVIADTYTDIRSQNTNFNDSTEKGGLQLKNPASGSTTRKVYFSFDLTNNKLPYVKEADIAFYINELMGSDKTAEIVNIYEVSDFDETTLTWATAPNNGKKVADVSYDRSADKKYATLDITNYLNEKLASEGNIGRINFVLQIEDGHDQKGAFISSKEAFPNHAAQLKIVEGLPAPTLEITGIEDNHIYTKEQIDNVMIKATSIKDDIEVNVDVIVNGKTIEGKEESLYDIPLQIGKNDIKVIATDGENNQVEKSYTVTRLDYIEAGTFYIDAKSGNDSNDGLSEDTAWKSLEKLNAMKFQPGTKLLFKRGSTWNGQFRPNGSGSSDQPIIVDAYGEGINKPIINGNGISNLDTGNAIPEGAVHLYNESHWEISNLEVTNNGEEIDHASRAGIMVVAGGQGDIEHIHINNVYVHDVNSGKEAQKISGGIIFRADTVDEKGNITGIESGFKDILVEDSHIKEVAIEGLRTKTYRNGTDTGNIKNYDVVFRNNLIEDIFGDGIVISEMESGGLVEKNIVRKHSNNTLNRNYAGLWLYQTNGVIIQYNEVYDGVNGYNDGEAFDFDIGTTNNIYQYNYSHNNRGGFLLTMSSAGVGNTFRYNISQNDGHGTETFFVMNDRTQIYNNTIYIGEGIKPRYFIHDKNIDNMFFKNNILYVEGEIENYSQNTHAYDAPNMSHNLIFPASIMDLPGSPNAYEGLVTENPLLENPDAENKIMDTWDQLIWDENISNFKLQENSPAIGAGTVIKDSAETDIFGTKVDGEKPDIGAHEFVKPIHVTGVTLSEKELLLKENTTYQLTATVLPEEATNKTVEWISSNHEVAEIDEDGLIIAKGVGIAVITVTTLDGNKTSSLEVTVKAAEQEIDVQVLQALNDLIAKAKSIKNNGVYTELSYATLQKAIELANQALEAFDSEDALLNATASLQAAIDGLEKVKTEIEESTPETEEPKIEVEETTPEIEKPKTELEKPKLETDKQSDDTKELPKTATSMYNLLVIGMILLLIGGISIYLLSKRKRVNN